MTPLSSDDAADRRYREMWLAAVVQVLREISGDVTWSAAEADPLTAQQADLEPLAELGFPPVLEGRQAIMMTKATAQAWAAIATHGSPVVTDDAARSAALGILEKIAEALQIGISEANWGDAQSDIKPDTSTLEPVVRFALRFQNGANETIDLVVWLDSKLHDAVRALMEREAPGSETAHGAVRTFPGGGQNLDLLLDVELDVSLRFGGRDMLLGDILELSPGSVFELDRKTDDPVELLVAGKTIAWGEVMVVDGNYGLRITRLVHQSERLAAMGGAR